MSMVRGAVQQGALYAAVLGAVACGPEPKVARVTLEARSNSTLSGSGTFTQKDGAVELVLQLAGVPAGLKGTHIHERGDCSAVDATSAGGHWALEGEEHGAPGKGHHIGELGNTEVGADGKGTLRFTSQRWKVGSGDMYDVVGRSLVIHGNPDDLTNQPSGNSGPRIGCGVVALKE
jgi:superoxide dismutase, Cu-Zn family